MNLFKFMKWCWIPFILSGIIQPLSAQSAFEGIRNDFVRSDEIITAIMRVDEDGSANRLDQTIYDASALVTEEKGSLSTPMGAYAPNNSSRQLNIAIGDFNGDSYEEYVLAYADTNGTISIFVPEIDPDTLGISSGHYLSIPGPIDQTSNKMLGVIKVVSGDFDFDRQDEFVVAYVVHDEGEETGVLHLDLFDTYGTLEPQLALQIDDITLETSYDSGINYFRGEVFDIVAEDLDQNGDSEFVLAWGHVNPDDSDPDWDISAQIFDIQYDDGYSYQASSPQDLDFPGKYWSDDLEFMFFIHLETGRLHNSVFPSLVAVGAYRDYVGWPYSNSGEETYIRTYSFGDDPGTNEYEFLAPLTLEYAHFFDVPYTSSSHYDGLYQRTSVATGDLNMDGFDDLAVLANNNIFIISRKEESTDLELKDNIYLTLGASKHYDSYFASTQQLAIRDMDRNGKDELVLADFRWRPSGIEDFLRYQFLSFSYNEDLSSYDYEAEAYEDFDIASNNQGQIKYAMAMGDFDGDRARLGEPSYFQETSIMQPLVILNAPPIHFDVIDGVAYDVNKCFNDNDCEHNSVYTCASTQTKAAAFEMNRDWGVSASVSASASAFGFGAEARIESSYGEKFSKMNGASESFKITTQVTAIDDDLLYATVTDYDIWEWPLFVRDTLVGHLMDIRPVFTEDRWFPSKSWSGYRYVPDHEVGNILSYQAYPSPGENPYSEEEVKGDFSSSGSFELSNNSSYAWWLEYNDFSTSSATTAKEIGLEVGAKVWGWGFEVETSASYSSEQISTHEMEVQDELYLDVNLSSVDQSIGEVIYTVSPYAYWSTNGSVTLDYAVRPDLPPNPGAPDTWWSENYGNEQDPAFILPWRLDEEKGKTLQDPLKKYQTKAIQISPYRPEVGDTVSIYATVHNFSLLPTDDQVKVSFYIGHPNMGGTLLEDVYGNTYVETENILQPRKRETVEFKWVYPSGLGDYPWLFAFIDPDGEMTEIHEDNNIGFNIIGASGIDPSYTEEVPVEYFSGITLYPNPARVHSVLEFYLQKNARVLVRVYDMNGRLVKTQVDANFAPGDYRTIIDVSQLQNGIYFVTVEADRERRHAKMVVIK